MPAPSHPARSGAGKRFAIVASLFNEEIVKALVAGATKLLAANGVKAGDVTTAWVPGAFELPLAAQKLASGGRYAAVICVGCVIKGETRHNELVSEAAARGIMEVSLHTGIPCTFGVITAENHAQAKARSGAEVNRGAEAAEAALEMANLLPGLE